MDNNRNLIIAVALSIALLLGWDYFVLSPQRDAERQQAQQSQTVQSDQAANSASTSAPNNVGGSAAPASQTQTQNAGLSTEEGVAGALTREQALGQSPRISVETPSVGGSIALKGAKFDDLTLHKFHVTVDKSSPDVVLLSPNHTETPYYSHFGWRAASGQAVALPDGNTLWSVEGNDTLTPETPVTLTWNNGQGLTFNREISVDKDYMFTVSDTVRNGSGNLVTLTPYAEIVRVEPTGENANMMLHEGFVGMFGDNGNETKDFDTIAEDGPFTQHGNKGWAGITDKYWATTIVPPQGKNFTGVFSKKNAYQADVRTDAVSIPPGGSVTHETKFFAGAKVVSVLDRYTDQGIYKFDLLIDWGWFYFLTKPVFFALDWIAKFVGNFGVAILILTVMIKLAFFPLANRSYEAMSRMKKLQPEIEKLRERYKDDRMKQQQELMDLYKRKKINPLAGCWPVLIQIPVFFSLYKVLFVTIEMRHAPFFGWIQDLSVPDPTTIVNLFGLIPWDPPSFLHLGAWPILMGISMFVQMRMNPLPADPVQKTVFTWMPVIFTFFLAGFPAGLVIYWTWNNTLSVLQQGVIMRRNNVPIELFGNIGLHKLTGRKPEADAEESGDDSGDNAGEKKPSSKKQRKNKA